MSRLDSEYFRSLLTDRLRQIGEIVETGDAAAAVVELDQGRTGRLTRMDALQSQAMSREAGRRRQIEITRIEQALVRIESGQFGICAVCAEDIGTERLKLDPANPLCIHCAK